MVAGKAGHPSLREAGNLAHPRNVAARFLDVPHRVDLAEAGDELGAEIHVRGVGVVVHHERDGDGLADPAVVLEQLVLGGRAVEGRHHHHPVGAEALRLPAVAHGDVRPLRGGAGDDGDASPRLIDEDLDEPGAFVAGDGEELAGAPERE